LTALTSANGSGQALPSLDYAFVQHTQPTSNSSSDAQQLMHTLLPTDLDVHLLQLHSAAATQQSLDCLSGNSAQMSLNCSSTEALLDQSTLNQLIHSTPPPPNVQLSISQSAHGKQIGIYHDPQLDANNVNIF
jgi:hypothetical protein